MADFKKKGTLVTSFIFFLLGGIEYAVILPTLNEYVHTFTDSSFYLGLVLSAFSLSGLLTAPIFGVLHDKLHKTKLMLLVANCFEIVGNLLYFFGFSEYMLVLSRFIAGIGAGVGASMLAQIARTTTEKERSSAFALFMAARQFGLIFGPGLNIFLEDIDITIGQFKCDKLTSPGLFMAFVWSVFQVMVVFLYYDLPFLSDLPSTDEVASSGPSSSAIPNGEVSAPLPSKEMADVLTDGDTEQTDLPSTYGSVNHPPATHIRPSKLSKKQKVMALLNEEIVVMLASTFIFFFNQTALEACLTPLTKLLLNLNAFGNSLLYCLAGVEIVIGFVSIKLLSKRVQDRVVLTIGMLVEIGSLTVLCVFLPIAVGREDQTQYKTSNFISLVSIFVVQVAGLPFILVANVSLLSKLVPEEIQGFSQGVRRSIMGMGTIMGPLWATGATTTPIAFSTVMVVLFTIVQIMIFMSWKKLAEPKREESLRPRLTSGTTVDVSDEKSPLLDNENPSM